MYASAHYPIARDSVKTAVVKIFKGYNTDYFKTTVKINLHYTIPFGEDRDHDHNI